MSEILHCSLTLAILMGSELTRNSNALSLPNVTQTELRLIGIHRRSRSCFSSAHVARKFPVFMIERPRNLVFVPANENSMHLEWIPDAHRDWQLFVNFYGDDSTRVRNSPHEYFSQMKGWKYEVFYELCKSGRLPEFDYIWMPDDDIETTWSDINRLFEYARRFDLQLAQPALTRDSHRSHKITTVQSHYELRYTSFVEIMCPLFSHDCLQQMVHTFEGSVAAWGLDYVWPLLLGYPKDRVAVIDAVPVKHSRPVGRSYDRHAAYQEYLHNKQKYGFDGGYRPHETFSEVKSI